jgi:ABC-type multidrug transport system fused ATPase/permease subunit
MTFLISHRFSTVRMADRILVLKMARIAERTARPAREEWQAAAGV